MTQPRKAIRVAVVGVIVLIHVAAWFLPVFRFAPSVMAGFHDPVYGFEVAIFGAFGIFQGALGWYANPLFWVGAVLLACGRFRASSVLALAGLLLASTSWFAHEWWFNEGKGSPIASYGIGFYVWFASVALLGISSCAFLLTRRNPLDIDPKQH